MNVPNLTDAELQRMKDASSEEEWNEGCDAVKESRGGQYPGDWFAKIIMSGLGPRKQVEWSRK